MNVTELIGRYLDHNRRLVVPGFGAFVVKESGEVVFSEMFQIDDGVLRALLAQEGFGEMECAAIIDRFIFETRHELTSFGYCRLGNLGTLRRMPDSGALRLLPLLSAVPSVASPAATTVKRAEEAKSMAPIAEPVAQPAAESRTASRTRRAAQPKRGVDRFVMLFAVVVLLFAAVAIGYGWYTSQRAQANTEQDDMEMESLRYEVGDSTPQR